MSLLFQTQFRQRNLFNYFSGISISLLLILFVSTAHASSISAPKGPVILTVEKNISSGNVGDVIQFDLDAFKALGLSTVVTKTPWSKDKVKFEGVYLSTLLDAVSAQGKAVSAKALNDYVSEIPKGVIAKYNPFIAFKADGKRLNRRGKGPLWIVFKFYEYEAADIERLSNYSVWQLAGISIKN